MPEGWDGTTRDPDEVHYEISMKEDEMLYKEFVQRLNFNKMKVIFPSFWSHDLKMSFILLCDTIIIILFLVQESGESP